MIGLDNSHLALALQIVDEALSLLFQNSGKHMVPKKVVKPLLVEFRWHRTNVFYRVIDAFNTCFGLLSTVVLLKVIYYP